MMLNAASPQLLAHDSCQRTAVGLRDIVYPKQRRVALVARAEGGYDADAALTAGKDQIDLAGHEVDGVHLLSR